MNFKKERVSIDIDPERLEDLIDRMNKAADNLRDAAKQATESGNKAGGIVSSLNRVIQSARSINR